MLSVEKKQNLYKKIHWAKFLIQRFYIPYKTPTQKYNGIFTDGTKKLEMLKLLQLCNNVQKSKFMLKCKSFNTFLRQLLKMARK